MTLLHRARPAPSDTGRVWRPGADWRQPVLSGVLAAAGSWLVLAVPALLVWFGTPHTTTGWGQALGVASAGWFLGHGSPLSAGSMSVSLVPLGLWTIALSLTTCVLGRLLPRTEAAAAGTTWPRLLARRYLPGFAAGYAGFAGLAWLLTLAGPARTHPLGVLVVLTVPVLAAAICLARRHTRDQASPVVGEYFDRLPRWATRAAGPALWGAGALLVLGSVLVLGMVVARLATVTGLHAVLGPGPLGGVVLTLGQLMLLPNLAIWALAWVAGPGFSVAQGSAISLSGAHPGLMPMLPVLGALPTEGSWPRWLAVVLALPVGIGFEVARRSCRPVARLASWRTKLATSAAAAAGSALAIGALTTLSTGSAGVERLGHVGPSPLALTAALLAELVLGAAGYVLVDQVRQRRRG